MRRAAERDCIEMHTLEVPRRLVFVRVSNRPEDVLDFKRDTPQRIAGEGSRRIGEIAPVAVIAIMQMCRMIKREPHALKCDQAVGELVLDRLELANRLPEL